MGSQPVHAAMPFATRQRFAAERAKASNAVGKMAADRDRIVGGQHALAVSLEEADRRARGLGGGIERPAEMLARMAAADGDAVMREHLVVELDDDGELRRERRRALAPAGCEIAGDLARQPRAALRGAADHHRIGARSRQRRHGVLERCRCRR